MLLHGIFRQSSSMEPMARFLRTHGYDVLNIDYPATRYSLDDIANRIHDPITWFNQTRPELPLHFVTHSMGGLVARVYLSRYAPLNLGQVVMLAPPNQGSEVADFWSGTWVFKHLFGPAGQQLTMAAAAKLPQPAYPVGIIAGSRSLYPLASWYIPDPDDGRVSLARTRLISGTAWVTIPATHPFIMRKPVTQQAVLRFMTAGRF